MKEKKDLKFFSKKNLSQHGWYWIKTIIIKFSAHIQNTRCLDIFHAGTTVLFLDLSLLILAIYTLIHIHILL